VKYAIFSLLLMASAAAFAQEGAGQGPPNTAVIVVPFPTLPTTTSTTPAKTPHSLVAAPTK
jgi:hypothetical protein